ncbi:hypothetical protein KIW84_060538 [Lathyrus oleraceus]|uniref:Uncharacterized protein n=1 Tax=Pisum sativum TaxID=3888 RepID=A0A9D5A144_PEA|nr:hypothetical protein KIW84_060538 [Pisum sativum]
MRRSVSILAQEMNPLIFYGKPALKARTGRWRSASLLLVNQGLIALAFSGVEANLVLFSKLVLKQTNVEAASTFSIWMGTTYFFSLIGAFLSDSYLGRYLTCIIFQFVFIIGLVMLSLSAHFLFFPETNGVPSLGSGVSDPALPTLGADQYLKKKRSPYLKVVSVMVSNDLLSLVNTRPLKFWKETLAILCSFAQRDEWTMLCDTQASKLMGAGNTEAATLCYICAGNIDKTVEI